MTASPGVGGQRPRGGGSQTWHSAAAAGPDERLAGDLQAAAERARDRGAWSATAAQLGRSVALTPDDGIRALGEVAVAKAELNTRRRRAAPACMTQTVASLSYAPLARRVSRS